MAYELFRNGSSGSDVKEVQKALTEAGYSVGNIDGAYGKKTEAAVKQYQRDNGLAVDGIAGPKTLDSLRQTTRLDTSKSPKFVTADGNVAKGKEIKPVAKTPLTPKGKPTPGTKEPAGEADKGKKDDPKKDATGTNSSVDESIGTPPLESAFAYPEFSYNPYEQSDSVKQANALLQQQYGNKPGAYQSQWQGQIDQAYDAYTNRDPFSYDFNSDALYQQYKDSYIQQGQMAMMDTMGQAAAMTGGYGNSYAQSVGQQVYNQHLNQLNDKIPQLYQMALDRYDKEGTNLYNQYNMLLAKENKDYARYQDNLSNWYKDLDYLTNQYNAEQERDYNQYLAGQQIAREDYLSGKNLAYDEYTRGQDREWEEYLKNQDKEAAAAEMMAGMGDFSRLGDVYGLSDAEVQKMMEAYTAANKPKSTGGNVKKFTKLSLDDMATMQQSISRVESVGDLTALAKLYASMGYNPDDINNLTSGKYSELAKADEIKTDVPLTDEEKKHIGGGGSGGRYYTQVK